MSPFTITVSWMGGMQDGGVGRIGIVGNLELGIDISRVDWPGELFISDGPDPKVLLPNELIWKLYLRNNSDEVNRFRAAAREPQWIDTVHPDITLERRTEGHGSTGHGVGDHDCDVQLGRVCHFGSILRITTNDEQHPQLVYVLTKYELERDAWWAQWPD